MPVLPGFLRRGEDVRNLIKVISRLQILPVVGARVGTGHPPHHGAILTRESTVVTPQIPISSYDTPIGAMYYQGIHAPGYLFMPIRKRPGTSIPYHVEYQTRIWFISAFWDLIIEPPSTRISRCSEFCTIPAIIMAIW